MNAHISIIVGRTTAGSTIYAAIGAPRQPGDPIRRGIVAHSAEVAALAPFTDIDTAAAELERLGCGPAPTGLRT